MVLKKKIVLIASIAIIIIIVILGLVFISNKNAFGYWGIAYIRHQVELKREEIIKKVENNRDIFKFLEESIYPYEENITITYEDEKIIFKENGKIKDIDQEYENNLTSLFNELNCESIKLNKKHYGKAVNILLGNVHIDKKNVYVHSIIYCESIKDELTDEIMPNWYYEVLFYV